MFTPSGCQHIQGLENQTLLQQFLWAHLVYFGLLDENKKRFNQNTLKLNSLFILYFTLNRKETVISSEPIFKEEYARFTTLHFKPLSSQ